MRASCHHAGWGRRASDLSPHKTYYDRTRCKIFASTILADEEEIRLVLRRNTTLAWCCRVDARLAFNGIKRSRNVRRRAVLPSFAVTLSVRRCDEDRAPLERSPPRHHSCRQRRNILRCCHATDDHEHNTSATRTCCAATGDNCLRRSQGPFPSSIRNPLYCNNL